MCLFGTMEIGIGNIGQASVFLVDWMDVISHELGNKSMVWNVKYPVISHNREHTIPNNKAYNIQHAATHTTTTNKP